MSANQKDINDRLMWLDGKILPVNKAYINVMSPTSQFGANVFEGIRCYWNEEKQQLFCFRMEDHYKRLLQSVRLFGLKSPYTAKDFEKYMKDVIKANDYHEDIAVRQTVFVDGFGSWFSQSPVSMFIAPIGKKRKSIPLVDTETCCISSWERINEKDMSPKIKVGANYINSRMAKLEATERGFDTALFLNREGRVSEGPGSCFFIVKDGEVITPSLEESILESITRDTVLKIASDELGLSVCERPIEKKELFECDEAFFCGSAVEVTPVSKIEDYEIGGALPGKITCRIHEKYLEIATGQNEKYMDWCTPIYEDGE